MQTTKNSEHSGPDNKLKVLHVLRAPVGGLFRHVCDLAREQYAIGFDVGIVCDSSTGSEFADSELNSLAEICTLGIHRIAMRRAPGFADFAVLRTLSRVAENVAPDILHGHGAKGAAYARMLAPRLSAKAVYTPHGGALHYSFATFRGAIYLTLERLLKRRTDGIIFESGYARQSYLQNVGPLGCPHRIIYNGLRESEFERISPDLPQYDFIFIGELRILKGIHDFLDAIADVSRHQEISVLIVGQGDQESPIRAKLSATGLDRFVTMIPSIHPVRDAFAQARCVVSPSLAESLPYVVLECLAAGRPLLATSVGGIPEIFGPYSGKLLPPGDATSLANAMRNVMHDAEDIRVLAEALRSRVRQHFVLANKVEATVAFYYELVNE